MKINGTNLSMIRGDSENIIVACTDKNGVNVPFASGDIIYFTVKEDEYRTEKLFQKKIIEFIDGKANITILPDDTKNLRFKTYKYDIQLNRADGTVATIISPSQFIIEGEITYE